MFKSLLLCLLVLTTSSSVELSGEAVTTRFYDSCLPSCAWPDKADFASLLRSVTKSGAVSTDKYAPSGCISTADNARFADPAQQPRAIDANNAIGFAAVGALNGHGERDLCCACMELTFLDGAVAGKKMTIQNINTGGDLASNHFDILIPASGVGIFTQGVTRQYGSGYSWGASFGGITTRSECYNIPAVLQPGCFWRFDWFHNADNPRVSFKQVTCPVALTNISKCIRADAAGVVTAPAPAPVAAPVSFKPTVKPTSKPTSTSTCPNLLYAQCGGLNFKGSACCPTGTYCRYKEPYWSSCHTIQTTCTNQKWAQCGGLTYTGQKCCPSGSTCKYSNQYYSQCLPI